MNPVNFRLFSGLCFLLLVMATTAPADAQEGGGSGGGRSGAGPRGSGLDFSALPAPKDDAERRILAVLEDMAQNQRRMLSVPRDDGRLLRLLVESVGAKHVVEVGTSHGYSAIWMALGLRKTGGKLTCHELDPERAALARENFKRAGVESVIVLVEGDAHAEVAKIKEPIDLVFLDADKEGYLDYFKKLLPLLRPGGLVVAHNMTRGQADPPFVSAISTNAMLDTIFVAAGGGGISMSLKKR